MNELARWVAGSIRSAGWVPMLVFAVHVVASRGFGAYEAWPALDVPMHLAGGLAIATFFRHAFAIEAAVPVVGRTTAFGRAALTLLSVCAATVVWELAEWTSDRIGFTEAQMGLDDTLLDMALGLVGGAAVVAFARRATPVAATRVAPGEPDRDRA
jgi:hypothetical protein